MIINPMISFLADSLFRSDLVWVGHEYLGRGYSPIQLNQFWYFFSINQKKILILNPQFHLRYLSLAIIVIVGLCYLLIDRKVSNAPLTMLNFIIIGPLELINPKLQLPNWSLSNPFLSIKFHSRLDWPEDKHYRVLIVVGLQLQSINNEWISFNMQYHQYDSLSVSLKCNLLTALLLWWLAGGNDG